MRTIRWRSIPEIQLRCTINFSLLGIFLFSLCITSIAGGVPLHPIVNGLPQFATGQNALPTISHTKNRFSEERLSLNSLEDSLQPEEESIPSYVEGTSYILSGTQTLAFHLVSTQYTASGL